MLADGNGHVVYMWQEGAAAPIHAVHFGFGLGTVIGPLMTGPFISTSIGNDTGTDMSVNQQPQIYSLGIHYNSNSQSTNHVNNVSLLQSFVESESTDEEWTQSRIFIPFSICAGLALISSLTFFCLYLLPANQQLYQRRSTSTTSGIDLNPGSCAGGDTCYGVAMFTLLIFLYILIVSKDTLVNTFLYVIAVDSKLAFSSWHGVLITTSYWIAYAASRLVFAVIGHFINVKVCSVTSVCCCRLHTTNTTLTYSLKRPYMNKL